MYVVAVVKYIPSILKLPDIEMWKDVLLSSGQTCFSIISENWSLYFVLIGNLSPFQSRLPGKTTEDFRSDDNMNYKR